MEKDAKVKELQQAYMEMQACERQLQLANQQLGVFDKQVEEIDAVSRSVAEMGVVEAGTGIFVPVANGIFVKAAVTKADEMLVNVGGGVVVPKTVAEVRALLEEQADRVREARKDVTRAVGQLGAQSKNVEAKLKKLIEG